MKPEFYLLVVVMFIANTTILNAQTTYTADDGEWNTVGTWDIGVPTDGAAVGSENIIIIPVGKTVTITGDGSDCTVDVEVDLTNVVVYVFGTLEFVSHSGCFIVTDGGTLNFNGEGAGVRIEDGGEVLSSGIEATNSMTQDHDVLFPEWWGSELLGDGDVAGPVVVGEAPNDPLPIVLVSWGVTFHSGILTANWSTVQEIDNDFYTIEESEDAFSFYPVAELSPSYNNSSELIKYTKTFSSQSNSSIGYYRLKQTDLDGVFSYSDIVAVSLAEEVAFTVYPNPVSTNYFTILNPSNEIPRISIVDIHTNLQLQATIDYSNNKAIKITLPENTKGTFLLSVSTETTVEIEKLIVK